MFKKLTIAILGTRGIPNKYGGFEQFAEYLSANLVKKGHNVIVYNPHFYKIDQSVFNGVEIIHKFNPEFLLGSAANFIYDYLCLKDALEKNIDIILECGYQSASISYYLCPVEESIVVTNMDGLEWKRAKWSWPVRKITKLFEKWGAMKSHTLIADNRGIHKYLLEEYGKESSMIPYGARIFDNPNDSVLEKYKVHKNNYYLLIARLEPENNIEMILEGYIASEINVQILIIGNHQTRYGEYLKRKFSDHEKILFLGAIYDSDILNNLRYFSRLYFHGHSVGGTNPSLLEAMACGALIVAHDNRFNRSVLLSGGVYFSSSDDIQAHLNNEGELMVEKSKYLDKNLQRISDVYNWENITDQYEKLFMDLMTEH